MDSSVKEVLVPVLIGILDTSGGAILLALCGFLWRFVMERCGHTPVEPLQPQTAVVASGDQPLPHAHALPDVEMGPMNGGEAVIYHPSGLDANTGVPHYDNAHHGGVMGRNEEEMAAPLQNGVMVSGNQRSVGEAADLPSSSALTNANAAEAKMKTLNAGEGLLQPFADSAVPTRPSPA